MRRTLPALLVFLCSLSLAPACEASAIGLANHRALPQPAPQPAGDGGRHGSVAPEGACSRDVSEDAPVADQLSTMRCLVDHARRRAGLGSLADSRQLDRSAGDKSADILRCKTFSHFACGREFTFWMQRVGYLPARCWRAGENLARGTGAQGSPGAIFKVWMHSPEHRANILGRYSQIGVGLRVGNLDGRSATHVWTQHFGSHCA
jgi:uncharacterized protein YkwD